MSFLQQLWQPFATLFHYVFYLPIFNVLMLLYAGVHAVAPGLPAFAIAIFFLTILVRLCLFPLTRKQLQSSRAMQALQPQMQELQRRYKNNPQELMAAQRALYQEHGVSMYGGCLPLLVQMPFLYGLYFSLYTAVLPPKGPVKNVPAAFNGWHSLLEKNTQWVAHINNDIYPFLPHLSIHTLPSTTFLWTNLADKDPLYILPIVAALLTFIQLRMAQPVKRPTPPGQRADANTQAMSSMQYFMPLITLFMAANFPSGLAFYWTISTGFSAVQQYLLTGFGSLFVGIPGMEHLVPEPQPLPSLPAARGATASGLVDTGNPPAARPSRLNAFAAMLRQLAEPPKTEEGAIGKDQAPAAPDKAVSARAPKPTAVSEPGATNGTTPPAARRPRPPRTGPTLVKPPSSSAPAAPTPASDETQPASGQPGEAATSAAPAEPTAPGPAAQPSASVNGTKASAPPNGVKPAASANGTTNGAKAGAPTDGARTGAPAKAAAPPRPASNGSVAKASSAKQPPRPASPGSRGSTGGSAGRRRPGGKSKGGR